MSSKRKEKIPLKQKKKLAIRRKAEEEAIGAWVPYIYAVVALLLLAGLLLLWRAANRGAPGVGSDGLGGLDLTGEVPNNNEL